MSRIWSLLVHDIRFQFRHGFYHAYLAVSLLYIVLLYILPPAARETATLLIIFTDTAMLGTFFIGALVLLEREQNTLSSLFVTPVRLLEYLVAKVLSLTFLALVSTFVIVISVHQFSLNLFFVGLAVVFGSAFFTLIGLAIATRSRSVPDYFLRILGWGILMCIPLVEYFDFFGSPLFFLIPSKPVLVLLDQAFSIHDVLTLAAAIISGFFWIPIAGRMAHRSFLQQVLQQSGSVQ